MTRLDLFLVYFKVFNSINGAAAYLWLALAGHLLLRNSVIHAGPPIHKIFDSSQWSDPAS
jgi:hypothetical protein